MGTVRYFSGAREQKNGGRRSSSMLRDFESSPASALMRLEILKKGKLPNNERYKRIMKKKFEENKNKALNGKIKTGFKIPGSIKDARNMSKRAEYALRQMAMKKAAKEEKKLRKMVLVTPRTYATGKLTEKGKVYDVAGNLVAEVNRKNGKMSTVMGWGVGRYKPKSYLSDLLVQDTIQKYSPYFINLRKMQAMQNGSNGVWGSSNHDSINIYGRGATAPAASESAGLSQYYGSDSGGPRQNVGMTAWGAMSDNTWGTFTDNVWGGSLDNVWGGNSTDIWGGIGVGGLWGQQGPHIWGTGNGSNYLKGLANRVAAFFGLKLGRSSVHETVQRSRNSTAATRSGTHEAVTRSGGAHESVVRSAPVSRAPTSNRRT